MDGHGSGEAGGLGFKIFLFLSMMLIVVGCFLPAQAWANPDNAGGGNDHAGGNTGNWQSQEMYVKWGVGSTDYNTFRNKIAKRDVNFGNQYKEVFGKWDPKNDDTAPGDNNAFEGMLKALKSACTSYGGKDCSKTKVVAIGAVLRKPSGRPAWALEGDYDPFSYDGNGIDDQLKDKTWKVFGGDVNITKPFKSNGENTNLQRIAESRYGNGVRFIVLIVDQSQVNPKGWYPTWGVTKRADLASANTLETEELQPCAAYWYVNATGIDGHVKGKTTKTTQYITPYGRLWNAVQTGGTWKSEAGKTYGPFKGDWQNQSDMRTQVKEARNVACGETMNMSIKYDYGNAVDGGTPSTDAVTITSKDDFLNAYARGGIYKIKKQVRNATITVKKTSLRVYERSSMRVDFTGWRECFNGQDVKPISDADVQKLKENVKNPSSTLNLSELASWNKGKCGYVGQSNPSGKGTQTEIINSIKNAYKDTSIPDHLNVGANGTIGMWYGNFAKNNGWVLSKNQSKVITEAQNFGRKGSDNKMTLNDGNRVTISKAFNRGYPTKWKCGNKVYTAAQMEGQDIKTGSCTVESENGFQFTNEVLGEWVRSGNNVHWQWRLGGLDAFLQGSALKSNAALNSYNAAVKPVSNRLQSIYTVAYQDFVNINCNRKDFEAFVNSINAQQASMGIAPDKRLKIMNSTKFNGTARTGVITTADVPTLAEIVPRVLGSTLVSGRTINGLGIKDVTGVDNPTIDGQSWTQYRRTNGKYNVGYNADKDPVYSKECPFDCTTETRASRVNASNVGRTNASGPDLATGAYGVRVNAKTGNGASAPESNTANMQFFRNNEWNLFKVDLYSPVAGSNNAGQVSYDGSAAKSTVITRNTDGTPWFSPRGQLLTNMEGKRNGSYRPIFTADYPYYQANKDSETAPIQLQSTSASTEGLGSRIASVQWPGQVNEFRIRSVWATENGTPLKFRFKWEYDATAHVSVPDKISFIGNGNPAGATTEVDYKTVAAKVDGKCLSQQNTLNPSPNTTTLNHDSSGSGTPNVDDRRFDSPDYGLGARGWISVTFVRATAE